MLYTEEERRELTKKKESLDNASETIGMSPYELAELESLYNSLEDDKEYRDSFNVYNSMTTGLSLEYYYMKGKFPKTDVVINLFCEEQVYEKYIAEEDEEENKENTNLYKVSTAIWDSPVLQDICQLKKYVSFNEKPSSKRDNIYNGVEIENPIWLTEPEREENFFYAVPDIPEDGLFMVWEDVELLDPSQYFSALYSGKTFDKFLADNIIDEITYTLEERKEFAEEYIEFINKILNYLKYNRKIEIDQSSLNAWNGDHSTFDDIHPLYASTQDEEYNVRRELYRLSRSNYALERNLQEIKIRLQTFIAGGLTPIESIEVLKTNRDVVIKNFMESINSGGNWVFSKRKEKIINRIHKENGSLRPFVRSRKNIESIKERLLTDKELASEFSFPLLYFYCLNDGDLVDRVIIERIFNNEISVGDIIYLTTDRDDVPELKAEVEEIARGVIEQIGLKEGESLMNRDTKIVDKYYIKNKRVSKIFLKNIEETSTAIKKQINDSYKQVDKFRLVKEIQNDKNFWGTVTLSEEQIF